MIKLKTILNEAFELPPEVDAQAEKAAKFIASFFLKYFELKLSHSEDFSDEDIVKYNEYRVLAKKYRNEGEMLFKAINRHKKTHWGISNFIITSKNDTIPDIVITVSHSRTLDDSVSGYFDDAKSEIFVLVNTESFVELFQESMEDLTETIKHELRHWYQFTNIIGLPKEKILNRNVDVLGYPLSSKSSKKDSKPKETPQEPHYMRDIEFKTNVHTYAFYMKNYLNKYFPKDLWVRRFKNMVGGYSVKTGDENLDYYLDNIDSMKIKDRPRWRQFVKELYKLIFSND